MEAELKELENAKKEAKVASENLKKDEGISLGKRGRPTKMTPEVVTKLLAAFHMGYNDTEAALFAGISRKTLYDWLCDKPDFRYKINLAKSQPNIKAKQVVIAAVNAGDVSAAKWWLERKSPEEFSTKTTEVSDIPPELEEHLNGLLEIVRLNERRIALHYRTAIFRLREKERTNISTDRTPGKSTIKDDFYSRLLALPDDKLTDHVAQEVTATGQDIAGVRDILIDRMDFQSMYERELTKAKQWND